MPTYNYVQMTSKVIIIIIKILNWMEKKKYFKKFLKNEKIMVFNVQKNNNIVVLYSQKCIIKQTKVFRLQNSHTNYWNQYNHKTVNHNELSILIIIKSTYISILKQLMKVCHFTLTFTFHILPSPLSFSCSTCLSQWKNE